MVVLSEGIEHKLGLKLLTFPLNGEEGKRRAGLDERKSGDAAMDNRKSVAGAGAARV